MRERTPPSLDRQWKTRVVAAARGEADERIKPVPVPADPVSRARERGMDLEIEPHRYVMRFQLTAGDLASASRQSLARWAHLVEVCRLPDWPLVSMSVEERTRPVAREEPTGTTVSGRPVAEIGGDDSNTRSPGSDPGSIRALPTSELLEGLLTPRPGVPGSPYRNPVEGQKAHDRTHPSRPL
jgi:hypothetical protein